MHWHSRGPRSGRVPTNNEVSCGGGGGFPLRQLEGRHCTNSGLTSTPIQWFRPGTWTNGRNAFALVEMSVLRWKHVTANQGPARVSQ